MKSTKNNTQNTEQSLGCAETTTLTKYSPWQTATTLAGLKKSVQPSPLLNPYLPPGECNPQFRRLVTFAWFLKHINSLLHPWRVASAARTGTKLREKGRERGEYRRGWGSWCAFSWLVCHLCFFFFCMLLFYCLSLSLRK